MSHLLLTNDYPPKIGGIQSYLWELWRRLPQEQFEVLTSPFEAADEFDSHQAHRVHRYDRFWLPPTRRVRARAHAVATAMHADAVVIDPAFPLGSLGTRLGLPYAVVLHGAEVSVPSHLPVVQRELKRVLLHADLIVSASRFAEREAQQLVTNELPTTVFVPPGVDIDRFVPLDPEQKRSARATFGIAEDAPLVVAVSRLVPRKGFDVLIEAVASIAPSFPGLQLVIAGTGRDEKRLRRLIAQHRCPAHLLGFVADEDLPSLYGCADVFSMPCRNRWGGLEQEGFGIVFVEAAASGCPQIAGDSGGSADAVIDGTTGIVVREPERVSDVAAALYRLLDSAELRARLGGASRDHAVNTFAYDRLAGRLRDALVAMGALSQQ